MSIPLPLSRGLLPLLCLAATLPVLAGQGLRVDDEAEAWPRWQARVGVTVPAWRPDTTLLAPATAPLPGLQLMGDYYFTGPGFGAGRVAGGLRATSGLLLGPRSQSLSTPSITSNGGLAVARRAADGSGEASSTVPYLGIGYTGLSARGGWGFTADLGLMALGGGLRVRPGAASNLDDMVRELRLSPVLQLGVSYAF